LNEITFDIIDNSYRDDLPKIDYIDEHGYKRFVVSGVWKGTYDNELNIYIYVKNHMRN